MNNTYINDNITMDDLSQYSNLNIILFNLLYDYDYYLSNNLNFEHNIDNVMSGDKSLYHIKNNLIKKYSYIINIQKEFPDAIIFSLLDFIEYNNNGFVSFEHGFGYLYSIHTGLFNQTLDVNMLNQNQPDDYFIIWYFKKQKR